MKKAKNIIGIIFTISVIAVLIGTSTQSYFSDTETSTGNTFTDGTIDLYLTDLGASADGQWYVTDWKPGEYPESGEIRIVNIGCNKGDHLEFEFVTTLYEDNNGDIGDGTTPGPEPDTDPDPNTGADSFDENIKIKEMYFEYWENAVEGNADYLIFEYDPTALGISYGLSDDNLNGYMDLEDLENTGMDNVPPPEIDTSTAPPPNINLLEFYFTAYFNPNAGNDLQGDICLLDVIVTLNQVNSQ